MGSFPVVYHLGPLTLTAYGIGLALSFWFGFAYTERRLRRAGLPSGWLPAAALWVIVAALVGARLADVATDPAYYTAHPADILAVWHGGLSSFGGLALGVPAALWVVRRRVPAVSLVRTADVAVPALVATWAVGRLLACQLEVGGGGPPTTAWYGLRYAGEVGKRVPVPLFQSAEDWVVFGLLIWLERRLARRGGPPGLVLAVGMGLWGLGRFFDQFLWLSRGGGVGAYLTEGAGLALAIVGLGGAAWLLLRRRIPPTAGTPGTLPADLAGRPAAVARTTDDFARPSGFRGRARTRRPALPTEPGEAREPGPRPGALRATAPVPTRWSGPPPGQPGTSRPAGAAWSRRRRSGWWSSHSVVGSWTLPLVSRHRHLPS